MKRLVCVGALAFASLAWSNDHNNIEAGRPLTFDDAYSIAYLERAIEFGLAVDTFRRRGPTYGLKAELKYGFAKNQDIAIAFEPHYSDRRTELKSIEIGFFHGIRREINDAPALGYRVDVGLPTGRGQPGVEMRVRGVATMALRQYDKLHLNLDFGFSTDPASGERSIVLGAVLGYSTPLGYPQSFDQTFVAEVILEQGAVKGGGLLGSVGLGLRRQMRPTAVLDFGLSSELFKTVRFTAGYSMSF